MNYPGFRIESCTYEHLNKHTRVFNKNEFEYHLYIHLDPEIARDLLLVDVYKLNSNGEAVKMDYGFARRGICWLQAITYLLDKTPGQHIYKLSMVNKFTDDMVSLYFSYIVQDDCPNKPYLYMKESKE